MTSPPFTIYSCYHCPNWRTIATIGPSLSSSRSTATLLHLIQKIDVATIVDAMDRQLVCVGYSSAGLLALMLFWDNLRKFRLGRSIEHFVLFQLDERFTVCKQQSESLGFTRNEVGPF
ncbi:hypothetical protein L2E82_17980 [Cichorium intybus]|uniref:Uncharacterized protein n=1 Tax=Cichorium intybus TaxID=13427 RepID=A0ACB9F8N3_CICIN|nr:hypothetical protein L2E82_17980 [Cichorium intybus]